MLALFDGNSQRGRHISGKKNYCLKPMYRLNARSYEVTGGNNRHEDVLRKCESLITKLYGQVSLEDIKKLAWDWNVNHCSPPLPLAEFERQWKCAVKYIIAEGRGYIQRGLYRRAKNPFGRWQKDVAHFIEVCRQDVDAYSIFVELQKITALSVQTVRKIVSGVKGLFHEPAPSVPLVEEKPSSFSGDTISYYETNQLVNDRLASITSLADNEPNILPDKLKRPDKKPSDSGGGYDDSEYSIARYERDKAMCLKHRYSL